MIHNFFSFLSASILYFVLSISCFGQESFVSIQLLDAQEGKPVAGAHVFIDNSSIGEISDDSGLLRLGLTGKLTGDLVVSHLSYETLVIPYSKWSRAGSDIRIEMTASSVLIDELEIVSSRGRKWKKQLAKFSKAFVGNDKASKSCVIMNPEVLRFEEKQGRFIATATDLIEIENRYLGYSLEYLLESLIIEEDGSVEFLGRVKFEDRSQDWGDVDYTAVRSEVYKQSARHFYVSLIQDRLFEDGYVVEMQDYNNGVFSYHKSFNRDSMFQASQDGLKFTLSFDKFLKVYNEGSRTMSYQKTGVRQGGLESQRFSAGVQEEKAIEQFDVSYLFKKSPYLILDQYGNVLNSKDIKEYGYWAGQKVSSLLPFDYVATADLSSSQDAALSDDELLRLLQKVLYAQSKDESRQAFQRLKKYWQSSLVAPVVELLRFINDDVLEDDIESFLMEKYELQSLKGYYDWVQWLWQQEFEIKEFYYAFKSEMYSQIDPRFGQYFTSRLNNSVIELDEVLWGGVKQDGIPPLRNPKMLAASEASYLDNDDVVFGLLVNGDARAYPKRILAWHEFFTDTVGGRFVSGVYCTLCGTVIAYDSEIDNKIYEMGTSGFLYRSNKLMYDAGTQSLWSTIEGEPVIGPLVGKGLKFDSYTVLTSTWGAWKKAYPQSLVLDINTGYNRNYAEGEAYKDYFGNDALMFPVPFSDDRLPNKEEVVVVRTSGFDRDPLAVTVKYIQRKAFYQDTIDGKAVVYVADQSGAVKVFDAGGLIFKSIKDNQLFDTEGSKWMVEGDGLVSADGNRLDALPSHSIFWFAWFNAFPETRLVR